MANGEAYRLPWLVNSAQIPERWCHVQKKRYGNLGNVLDIIYYAEGWQCLHGPGNIKSNKIMYTLRHQRRD
ncbi:uncharacterized protein GLRG_08208 [Colletotrichum graminicola M1.001]|uniref:Uncharacterized protein n=1 Tax=Colletotrichum graminicola (strain M1.001 / M2 / FGSC 10212) TaxID=645133 RepID=E3QQC6_COLGM|nr:uncharacterized protein GLRG_08208 [Colletotrichum graminicola M1.001]EFQ33064.1 hypothetical protein GLRG_08208 [Colletotrichum graminicola M1.001]